MWSAIVFGGTAAAVLAVTASTLVNQRWVRRLPALATPHPPPGADGAVASAFGQASAVRCTAVVAARDEAQRIEATVRHLLAQRGVAIDVIVVDDRSRDGTTEILKQLALEDPRVHVLRVDVLPNGWLGKCHACHVGAAAATGEWVLFTDADCWLKPDVVARALQVAARESADHITLTPGVSPETLAARAWHLAFLASLCDWIAGANRDSRNGYVGIGAFNFVRAAAYRECGGYEALRLTVLDDMKLGRLLQRAGTRTRGFIGGDDVECHWGTTARSMFHLMEKNYFAAVGFNLIPVIALTVLTPLLVGAAIAGPWTGSRLGLAAGLAPASLMIPAAIFARRLGWPIRAALLTPFLHLALIAAFLRSAYITLRQGGIWWRDTFYPVDILKKGRVR